MYKFIEEDSMLTRIDAFLLDKMQKFCDKLQEFTGLTKFCVMKWTLILYVALVWMHTIFDDFESIDIICAPIITVGVFVGVRVIGKQEKEFLNNKLPVYSPFHWASVRILAFWAFAIPALIYLCSNRPELITNGLSGLCVIVFIYAWACIPRPPSKSKTRQMYEKVLMWLNGLLVPPVPVGSE